MVLLNK